MSSIATLKTLSHTCDKEVIYSIQNIIHYCSIDGIMVFYIAPLVVKSSW